MIFRVERGIPIPTERLKRGKHVGGGAAPKYPWQLMGVGDSFLVPAVPGFSSEVAMHHASRAASQRGAAHGERYTCRSVVGGVRVWRVE